MAKKRSTKEKSLSELLRDLIANSHSSRYVIAKETGIAQSTLSRFMSGESGMSIEAVEGLIDFFGLDVVAPDTAVPARAPLQVDDARHEPGFRGSKKRLTYLRDRT